MRVDKKTGKKYTEHNIPMDKVNYLVIPGKVQFCIMNENYGHESDVWYNDTFCGDRYAVFERTVDTKVWQQVSPWYVYYGKAVNKMLDAYNKRFIELSGEEMVNALTYDIERQVK